MTAEYTPLPRLFLDAMDRFANPRAQMYRTAGGWEPPAVRYICARGFAKRSTVSRNNCGSGVYSAVMRATLA